MRVSCFLLAGPEAGRSRLPWAPVHRRPRPPPPVHHPGPAAAAGRPGARAGRPASGWSRLLLRSELRRPVRAAGAGHRAHRRRRPGWRRGSRPGRRAASGVGAGAGRAGAAATGALFVVVTDDRGVRYSHPNPELIGQTGEHRPLGRAGRPGRRGAGARARSACPRAARRRCATPAGAHRRRGQRRLRRRRTSTSGCSACCAAPRASARSRCCSALACATLLGPPAQAADPRAGALRARRPGARARGGAARRRRRRGRGRARGRGSRVTIANDEARRLLGDAVQDGAGSARARRPAAGARPARRGRRRRAAWSLPATGPWSSPARRCPARAATSARCSPCATAPTSSPRPRAGDGAGAVRRAARPGARVRQPAARAGRAAAARARRGGGRPTSTRSSE